MSAVSFEAVSKGYGPVTVLDRISLTVEPGSVTVIVGASGSGKTTLLRLISGFEQPDSGTISIGGTQVAGADVRVPAHRRGVGLVAQDGALFPHLSVQQNITFGIDAVRGTDRRRLATELLELVSLDSAYLDRRPDELSGGQQQRIALARALARRPSIMLLDEPFAALDTGLRESTRLSISKILREQGITTVLVTHDQAEALSFGDQLAVLHDGRVSQVGRPRDLYSRPADLKTAGFLGQSVILPAIIHEQVAQCALGLVPAVESPVRGAGFILFRPEQLVVVREEQPGARGAGVVVSVEFLGSADRATIRLTPHLETAGVDDATITVLCSSSRRLVAGDHVSIRPTEPGLAFA